MKTYNSSPDNPRRLLMQTHISETPDEVAWVKELFPGSLDYAGVYADAGLLTRDSVMAHCVHLNPRELGLFRDRNVGISHCPTSNLV